MKRSFLRGLGIEDDETLNAILKEYGTSVDGFNTTINTLKEEKTSLDTKYQDLVVNNKSLEKEYGSKSSGYAELKEKYSTASKELESYQTKNTLKEFAIADEFTDYVSYKVKELVTDEKDFKTALSEYVEENPQFKANTKEKINTSHTFKGEPAEKTGTESINQFIRGGFTK